MCKKFKSETAENLKLLTGRFPIFQISLAGQFCFVAGNIRREILSESFLITNLNSLKIIFFLYSVYAE